MLGLFTPSSTVIAPRQEVRSPAANELTILHPHSSDFAEWVIEGYKTWHIDEYGIPPIVSTSEKYSDACLEDIQAWNGTNPEADVWWGGGEYLFEVGRDEGLLEAYEVAEDANIPASLGGWHLKDDSGDTTDPAWYAAAISGFGIIYNKDYLNGEGLAAPKTWEDLTDYSYDGHIVMADPTASGSTTATVKMLLQEFCDQTDAAAITDAANTTEAWQLWAKIAGNIGLFTTSSSQVPREVDESNYGIGICIDYYGYDKMDNPNIGFTYGGATTVSPDPAGIIKGTPHLTQAQRFMDYLTGTEGQTRVGKYRTPANKMATTKKPIPAAWTAAGASSTDFPAIVPFSPSLDGAMHSRARNLFHYWLIQNTDKATAAYAAIGAQADDVIQEDALELYVKLPSNFDGTIAGLLSLDYHDTAVTGLWQSEGATNFDAAKAKGSELASGEEPKDTGDEGIPGFEALIGLVAISSLIVWQRKRK